VTNSQPRFIPNRQLEIARLELKDTLQRKAAATNQQMKKYYDQILDVLVKRVKRLEVAEAERIAKLNHEAA
jgi:hypothetical protein